MKLFQIRQMLKLQPIDFLAFLPPFLCVSLSPALISRAFLTISVWQLLNMNWFLLKPLKIFNMPQRAWCLQFTLKWFRKKREREHMGQNISNRWMWIVWTQFKWQMHSETRQTKTLEFGTERGLLWAMWGENGLCPTNSELPKGLQQSLFEAQIRKAPRGLWWAHVQVSDWLMVR